MRPHVIRSNIRSHLKTCDRTLYHTAVPYIIIRCYKVRPHDLRYCHVLNSQDMAVCCKVRPYVLHVKCGRMLVNLIWYLIYFYTDVLQEFLVNSCAVFFIKSQFVISNLNKPVSWLMNRLNLVL